MHNVTFIENYLLDKIAFYFKQGAKNLLKLPQIAHNNILLCHSAFNKTRHLPELRRVFCCKLPVYFTTFKSNSNQKAKMEDNEYIIHLRLKKEILQVVNSLFLLMVLPLVANPKSNSCTHHMPMFCLAEENRRREFYESRGMAVVKPSHGMRYIDCLLCFLY